MKITLKFMGLALLLMCFFSAPLVAQVPGNIILDEEEEEPVVTDDFEAPLDGVAEKNSTMEKLVLPYDHIREADIMWEKRIWRVIDIREKMNLPFAYPERPFISILMDATQNGELRAYSGENDKFTELITPDEVASMGASVDTVVTFDPETYEEKIQVVRNELNPEDIKRFRIKEMWFIDKETSTMQVRILGIAPLLEVKDENGNLKYELPMFWIYYPEARELLARERVFNYGNDASPISWEDLMEMRFFASYIYKESNNFDRKLEEYLTGVDLLLEGEKIKNEIFNREQDLWSY